MKKLHKMLIGKLFHRGFYDRFNDKIMNISRGTDGILTKKNLKVFTKEDLWYYRKYILWIDVNERITFEKELIALGIRDDRHGDNRDHMDIMRNMSEYSRYDYY